MSDLLESSEIEDDNKKARVERENFELKTKIQELENREKEQEKLLKKTKKQLAQALEEKQLWKDFALNH